MTNTPLAKVTLGGETLGFLTGISESGGTYTAILEILNRNGPKIQRLGSTGRGLVLVGFVESTSGNMETTKGNLETYRNDTATYALTIKSVSDDAKYFIEDISVFVEDVRWTGMMSGTPMDRWFYEVTVLEDTN